MKMLYALILTLACIPAYATPQVMIYGRGLDSCSKFLADQELNNVAYQSWAAGYISASDNLRNGKPPADLHGAMSWLTNYCTAHPEDSYFHAVNALNNEVQ